MILSQCGQQLANNQCSLCLFLDLISPWLSRVLRNCLNILDFWLPECKRRAVFFWEFRDLTLLYNNILKIIHPMPSPLRIRNLRVNDQQRGHPWHYLSAAVQSLSFCHFAIFMWLYTVLLARHSAMILFHDWFISVYFKSLELLAIGDSCPHTLYRAYSEIYFEAFS